MHCRFVESSLVFTRNKNDSKNPDLQPPTILDRLVAFSLSPVVPIELCVWGYGQVILRSSMEPRWKGKGSEAKAISEPMSRTVSQLQSSMIQSEAQGLLSGSNVLICLDPELADLFGRACFGVPITTSLESKKWFQLEPVEAFYLSYALKCLNIVDGSKCLINEETLWRYLKSKSRNFPRFYLAYSRLRTKNWVVMSGVRYGTDFVAYRHHPELVHSEFAVLVLSEENGDNSRLRVWSDVHCSGRLCGGVAKTLLVLDVSENGRGDISPSCLEGYSVEERTITRWLPEKCRENSVVRE